MTTNKLFIYFFSGILSLQVLSKMNIIFYAIGCLLTIVVLLYVDEVKHKSIRPVYPIICLQNQGFIWLALRLKNDHKFYKEFEESTVTGKILYIWIMQLFSIFFAVLVHLFLIWLQNLNSIRHLDKNSTSIMMFYYITDSDLLKKLLIDHITKMIKYLNSSLRRCTTKVTKFLTDTRPRNIRILIRFLRRKIVALVFWFVPKFVTVGILACVGFIAYKFFAIFNATPLSNAARYVLLFPASAFAFTSMAIAVVVVRSAVEFIAKLLKRVKYTLIFLIVFIADYFVISVALYFLSSTLPFNEFQAIYVLIAFLPFSFNAIRGLLFYCDERKQAIATRVI